MFSYSGIQMVKPVRRAVVVGGGFIGLETAENLVHLGFDVTLIQKPDHVLSPLDPEIACLVQGHIEKHGVKVVANDGVVGFKQLEGGALEVQTSSGKDVPGGHRDPRDRREAGHHPGQDRPASRSVNAAASAWTSTCAPATRTSLPSAMPSK